MSEQSNELENWRKNFEKQWGCTLSIEKPTSPYEYMDIDSDKIPSCPICNECMYEGEATSLVIIDGHQALIHANCHE